MVLEGASASQDDSFTEFAPSSDVDPYAGSNDEFRDGKPPSHVLVSRPGQPSLWVNIEALRRPLPMPGLAKDGFPRLIQASCAEASSVLGRPLRQEEADAVAFGAAKSVNIASYGTPVGLAMGSLQCFMTAKEYRFPLWRPMKKGGRFSPDVFGPFRGSMARAAWHFSRFNAYAAAGSVLGQIFFTSYALTVGLTDRVRDPRLKELNEATLKRARTRTGSVPQQRQDESDGPRKDETFAMARQRRAAQRASQNEWEQRQARESEDDDMSPTSGAFRDEFTSDSSGSSLMDDAQMQRKEQQGQRTAYPGGSSQVWTQPDADSASTSSSQYGSSSTSSSQPSSRQSQQKERNMADASSASPRQTGSAWDRVRQNAISGQQTQTTKSPRSSAGQEGQATGGYHDDFSFSRQDEDRQLAKAEAQKEFDERLERERAGQDFNEKSNRAVWRR